MQKLLDLAGVFSYLSLLTVGGGMAAYPELSTLVVTNHHWLTSKQLIHLYSIGQMAPGPNMMMVAAIGQLVAGIPGALITVSAFFGPTALLTFLVGRVWDKLASWPWRASIQRGLAPVSVGLLLAGCITIAKEAFTGWGQVTLALAVFFILMRTKLNPAVMVLAGAIIGFFAFSGLP